VLAEETLLLVHGGGVDLWAIGCSRFGEIVSSGVEIVEIVSELKLGSKTIFF
jgi:hypothetical protein